MPEEHDLPFRDLLGPGKDQLDYIVKMSTGSDDKENTYLLLYETFLGLISSILNHAK